jgi:hypothetical protein
MGAEDGLEAQNDLRRVPSSPVGKERTLDEYSEVPVVSDEGQNAIDEVREVPDFTQIGSRGSNATTEYELEDDGFYEATPREQQPYANNSNPQSSVAAIEAITSNNGADLVVIENMEKLSGDQEPGFDWQDGFSTLEDPELELAGPPELRNEPSDKKNELANFSNLSGLEDALRRIEARNIETDHSDAGALDAARSAVMIAIHLAYLSRFYLGKVLLTYKSHFKAELGWMDVSKAIGNSLHCSDKTVRNIIADCERLSAALPAAVIEAAEDRRIDLARKKYEPEVKAIAEMVGPNEVIGKEEAIQIVAKIIPISPASKDVKPRESLDDFANRTTKSFEKRYAGILPEVRDVELRYILELVNATLRTSVKELRQYGRPALVPKPATNHGGVA